MRIAWLVLLAVAAQPLPDRWFYLSRNFSSDRDVTDFADLTATAAQHGCTGVMLAGPFDNLDRQSDAVIRRLLAARPPCASRTSPPTPAWRASCRRSPCSPTAATGPQPG